MRIEQVTIQKILVTELQGLDPISIYLEDLGTGRGKITITCFDQSWTSYWGAIGNRTIAEFITACDIQYLAKNLSKIPAEINDRTSIIEDLFKTIIRKRRANELDPIEAREYYDIVDGLQHLEPIEILSKHDLFYDIYGDEWWHCIPTKPNPDYEYLCRIITAVKEALCSIKMDRLEDFYNFHD